MATGPDPFGPSHLAVFCNMAVELSLNFWPQYYVLTFNCFFVVHSVVFAFFTVIMQPSDWPQVARGANDRGQLIFYIIMSRITLKAIRFYLFFSSLRSFFFILLFAFGNEESIWFHNLEAGHHSFATLKLLHCFKLFRIHQTTATSLRISDDTRRKCNGNTKIATQRTSKKYLTIAYTEHCVRLTSDFWGPQSNLLFLMGLRKHTYIILITENLPISSSISSHILLILSFIYI